MNDESVRKVMQSMALFKVQHHESHKLFLAAPFKYQQTFVNSPFQSAVTFHPLYPVVTMTTDEQKSTVKNEFYRNFLDTICKTHFKRQFCVPQAYSHNSHPFKKKTFQLDAFHECKHDGIPKCARYLVK